MTHAVDGMLVVCPECNLVGVALRAVLGPFENGVGPTAHIGCDRCGHHLLTATGLTPEVVVALRDGRPVGLYAHVLPDDDVADDGYGAGYD